MLKTLRKELTVSDVILILLILIAAVTIFAYQQRSSSLKIRITYRDHTLREFSGMDKANFTLPDGHGVIEVDRGRARILNSDCHSHLCEKQGWSSSLPIVCAPNKVLVEFIPVKEKDEIIILH